jgi:sulfoxide reductase heme-binding subunit YedZ
MAGLTLAALATKDLHALEYMRGVAGLPLQGMREAMVGAASPTWWWYLTRTTAVAAYIALFLSVFFGMLRSIARVSRERLTWVVDEAHATIATLAGLLTLGHLVSLKVDDFIPFTFTNLLAPGDQPYRPLAVNLGVFALYTLALTLLSSWLRRYISYRLWRAVHYMSFVAFALVTAHGWLAGSDADEAWLRAIYVGASSGIGFLVLMRLFSGRRGATVEAA